MLAVSAAALGRAVRLVDAATSDAARGDAQAALLGVVPATLAPGTAVPVSATLALAHVAPGDAPALAGAVADARAASDLVIVDAGSRLAGVEAALAGACLAAAGEPAAAWGGARNPAALLLVVTGTDAPALAAAYALVKVCASGASPGGISHGDVAAEVLVAGVDAAQAAAAAAHLDEGTRHFLARPLRLAAAVPDDPSLAVALGAGMTVHDAAAGSPAAAALHALAERAGAAHDRMQPAAAPPRSTPRSYAYAPSPASGSALAR